MKRILSLLLALCMVFTLVSSTVYAAGSGEFNVDDTVCENHKEHDESCGYIKAAEGAPCSHQNEDGTFSCAPDGDSSYVCPHDDGCGYTHAAEGAPCTHECELCGDESRQECTCNTLCTEDEMNPDCPICGVEGADPSLCESASDAHLLTTLRNAITIDTTLDLGSVTTDTNCTIAGSHTHGDNFCWAWYTSGVELEGKSYTGNVLVLNGVDITCTDDTTGILVPENTTIVTVSDSVNTVTAADNDSGDSYGIYGLGDLTFDGNGTLNIVGGEATDGLSYGIYALGKVRIKGGIVNAKGGVSGSSGGKGPFTVSFDSDGGQAFEPVTVAKGGTLTDLPVPGKSGCVFTAWYLDETPVGTDTEFYSDATLVAKYETLSGNELQYTDTTYTLTKVSPDQSFIISAAGKTAEQVKAGLTFEILDNSGDVELQVTGSSGTFTVKAKDGFTPGGAYRLTLGSGLRFSGQNDTVRNCEFTVDREEVFELEFNQNLNFLSMDNLSNIVQNGKVVRTLNSPLYQFTSQSTSRITKDSGTFRLNSGTLGVGDVVCFYSGEKPEVGDDEAYLNDNIAYVKITAVNGNVYSYVTAEPEEVLQMPDVLPVSSTADTDGDADNLSITVAKNSFDYSAPQYAESGLNAATTVDEGDFLFFYSGTYGMSAEAVGYGRVTSVEQFGDYLVVTYEEATEDDIENVLNYYSENDVDAKKLIQDIDISELETDIENQAKQSGFADAAAAYLIDTALKTDGFNNALEGFDPDTMQVMLEDGSSVSLSALQAAKSSVKPVLTNLKVKAQIGTNSVHFDGNGIRTALDISFTLTIFNQDNQGVNLTVSASFVEELKMEVSASGDTIWKKKWIFPYIADYQFNTNLDVYNYTSIDIRSQVTDKEGYTIADISNEIKSIIEMTNGEDIKSGVSNLYDLYDELLDTDGDWVKIFEKQISKMDMRLLLGIINVRFTTAFVVSVDMRVALGMQYEYFSADRYCFWTRIKAKEADSNTIRLEDQKTTFQFYVVGTVGIRAGIKIEIAVGLFSVDIASVGLGAEAGAYLRLSGYFYYTTTSTNNVITSSKTAGALYMEIGVYLDVTFNAQVLGGKFQYSPSLFYKEWPIIKAGRQKNVQDFAAADGLTEINLKLYEKNFTLPEGFYDLKYLDMANGEYSTVQPNDKDLEIITTNPAVTVQDRQIKINPGAATTVRATITVRYKNGQLAFSSMPITRTLKVYWSALDDRSYIKFAWGNLETIAAPPGDPITPPVEPTRSGYDFDGWYTDAECKNAYSFPATMPEGDVTLYAKWTPQEVAYQVMHYQQALKGGTNVLVDVDELTGLTGSTPTLAYKTYPGFDNPTAQPVAINGDGSTVIRLIYPRKNYTITLENISNNSGEVIELEVPYGQTITLPVIAREGHTFTGWDQTPPATMPANNLTYTANWTRNKYNVEYTLDNVKLEDESKDYLFGSDLYKPTPKPGYEFSGWYTDAACKIRFTQNTTPGRDIKLFGKFIPRTDTMYKVEHYWEDLTGGGYTRAHTDTLGGTTDKTVTAAAKDFPGFTFNKNISGTVQSGIVAGDGSLVLKLYYTRNSYTITFVADDIIDSELPASITKKYGDSLGVEPEATAAVGQGYDFAYWWDTDTNENNIFEFDTMPAKNVSLKPRWFPRGDTPYRVEYYMQDANGEYVLEPGLTEYKKGTTNTTVSAPRSDFDSKDYIAPAASNLKIYRRGTTVVEYRYDRKKYTVTYDATGGTISGTPAKSLMWGAPLPKDIEITRENFEFVGWYRDRAMSGDPVAVMPNENVTLYARWKLKDDLEGQELNFGIELGGKAITSKNYTNLSALLGSDLQAGTITYDPGTNVLTLSNVLYEPYPFYSKTSKYNLPAIIFANTPDTAFVIKLVGDNKIHYNWQSGSGVLTRYVIDVTAKELIITTDSKDVRGTLTSDPNTTERIYASIGITLRENTDRITVNNAAQVLMYLNPDGSEKTHGIYKVGAATSNLSVNIHDNASLALLSINGPPANFVKASLNVNSTNARLVLGGNHAFGDGAPSGTSIDDIIYTINLSTVGKYYTYSGSLPTSASQLDSKINTESTSQRLDVRLKAIRIGSTPVFPVNTSASQSPSIKDAVMPLNFVPRNAVTLLSTATETETASSGCGIYAESITITGGTVTAAGEKAMNIAPDLSGYGNYIATASADVEGQDAVTYNPEEIEGYCYFHVESAPTYGVTLSHSGTYPFPSATAGYEAQTPQTVTVTNAGNRATGELTVALSGDNADSFTLSSESISDIPSPGSDSFTIAPVTGLDAGTYTATVTVSGENDILASFSVSFTVLAPVTLTSMSIQTEPRTNYFEGETLDLSGLVVTLHYNNGDVKTVPFAEFETNGLIAEPANGTVLAASSTKVTITHEATDKLVELPITVTEASSVVNVTGVTVSPKNVMLYSNITTKAAQLKASVTPENATDKSVSWHSSNPAVAAVDANGKVTALSNGTATITVTTTDGGFTDSCVVTVSTYRSGGSSGGSSSDTEPSSNFLTATNNTGIGIDISSINLPEGVTLVSPHIYGLPTSTTGRAWTLLLTKAPASVGRSGVLGGRKYLALYQFKLLDENGKKVHNVGWTTIHLPLPKGANPSSLMVLYYDDKARTFTNMGARVEGDFLVFRTSHFSYYMITGVPESVPAIPETGGGNPSEVPQTEVTITPIPAFDSKRRRLIG